uniref:SET domain-containing protein n=1 Tax=Oncorhynchus mykiss TaxID=8022 RepID=A0A8K9XGN6_ONCMY
MQTGNDLSGGCIHCNMMKGTFTRKDNGKVLTTTRAIVGEELVQSYSYDGVEAKRIFKRG